MQGGRLEPFYNKINDYGSVKIRLASPEDIRSWSYGEVKKPETINYRTYRAEKDGLFCEKIFGPERDWECFCGKYKGIKHKGVICDRCGVTVTHSRVRRKRMGHINLAAPVSHIWFFKAMPSRMGTLLAMKTSDLERVVYFQDYVVIDPGSTSLKQKQLLTEDEFRNLRREFGDAFKAGMGAEALRDIIRTIEFKELSDSLREDLGKTKSKQRQKDIIKRLKLVEAIRDSENMAEWMVLDVIPVIPPDLRPLVLLESGNFATSDLNDLYRRLINRNNRLKKLLDLNAPEVIIRNEKRMLQQSVDALFDNGRCRRPVLGSANRPLKSLTDMIKGKQGRFRENLLGKRVDYSARSVIVVGPELKLHQCGLPKKIALELYQPFIIRRLKELGFADTIKSAKKMLERKDEEVWDILDDVIRNHPVMLNRAPTLHRMGIQAFEPILVEGNAIKIHPLVCAGFNADFDGDQMAVHLPLSLEAQVEANTLLLSTHNIFSPAHGQPIIAPSQDIVLGCYYLTVMLSDMPGEGKSFTDVKEVFLAHSHKKIHLHAKIKLKAPENREVMGEGFKVLEPGGMIETTPGRVIFNDIIPSQMPFYNLQLKKGPINKIISQCHERAGTEDTLELLDRLKDIGFNAATLGGISFSKNDLRMPKSKEKILQVAQSAVDRITRAYEMGAITDGERHNQIVDVWTHAREKVGADMMEELRTDTRHGKRYLNPIYMMADSGARGSLEQIRQLAGMRGLMAKPSGKIIETPIKANFREGLKVLEYFSSTHGARKGLADTALKTADSGYLTRKLADVAQNVVVNEHDCGTLNGITKATIFRGEKVEVALADQIRGRVALETIVDKRTGEVAVSGGNIISEDAAKKIQDLGYDKIRVRSALTCETPLGLCAKCYGMDLSKGLLVEEGLAVGTIGAQSIGEPGTQLTMRTFHIGGTAHKRVEESEFRSRNAGRIKILNVNTAENDKGEVVVLKREGEIVILDSKNDRELERHAIPLGAILHVSDGDTVQVRKILVKWDPFNIPILAEQSGRVRYEDIVPGVTMKEEFEGAGAKKVRRREIIEHKGDLHPQIIIEGPNGAILGAYHIPEKANLEVDEGQSIVAGTLLAKTAREITGTQDITGGLPRVTELFEARRPKNPSVISEIDGVVDIGEKKRGKRTIIVRSDTGMEKEHLVPQGKHLRVHKGTRLKAGDPLVDGPLVLHDILRINGDEMLQQYLLKEIQNVYRSQNVTIDDKHVEIIIAQMMRKVNVNSAGDTEFLPGSVVDKFLLKAENRRVQEKGGRPASFAPLLLGITKASLQSPSFISAASFQETTKVLTEAALAGKVDQLLGLKENVILGHMIPAGTGFKAHFKTIVQKNVEPSVMKVLEEQAEIDEEARLEAEEESIL